MVCASAGGTPAATAEDPRPRKLSGLVRPDAAEREREGSVARSAQQMNARRADLYRERTMPARWAKAQRARTLRREEGHPKIWNHRAPNFSFGRKQLRAEFCNTAPATTAVLALPAWNGTDTRFAPNRSSSPPRRARNDSRLQSRNKLQLQPPRSACSLSSRTSIAHQRRISNIFFRRINNRRDSTRSNSTRRYIPRLRDWFNRFLASLVKLRLLYPRGEQHGSK